MFASICSDYRIIKKNKSLTHLFKRHQSFVGSVSADNSQELVLGVMCPVFMRGQSNDRITVSKNFASNWTTLSLSLNI